MTNFRISQTKGCSGTVVNIDGQLVGDSVQIAKAFCSQALSSGESVCVFLRDVSVIDEAGRNLLRHLAEQGIRLLASGVYTSHIVKSLQRDAVARQAVGPVADQREHK